MQEIHCSYQWPQPGRDTYTPCKRPPVVSIFTTNTTADRVFCDEHGTIVMHYLHTTGVHFAAMPLHPAGNYSEEI